MGHRSNHVPSLPLNDVNYVSVPWSEQSVQVACYGKHRAGMKVHTVFNIMLIMACEASS